LSTGRPARSAKTFLLDGAPEPAVEKDAGKILKEIRDLAAVVLPGHGALLQRTPRSARADPWEGPTEWSFGFGAQPRGGE
jgi:hypothetical protein